MLKTLAVQNFAIIENLHLEFDQGLCVISGETGAGKSILIEALGLAIGRRVRPHFANSGEKVSVTLDFDVTNSPAAANWLAEHDADHNCDCVLRRTISPDGRSRAYINGVLVTAAQLQTLGKILIDIVGQNTHQFLMQPPRQLEVLDLQCDHSAELAELSEVWNQWKRVSEQITLRSKAAEEMQNRIELLRYQVNELEEFAPEPGEFETIEQEHKRLSQIDALLEKARESIALLDGSDEQDIYTSLAKIKTRLEGFADLDKHIANAISALDEALENTQSASNEINASMEKAGLSDEEFMQLETRLSRYLDLSRKHQVPANEIADLYQRISNELETLTNPKHSLEALEQAREQHIKTYQSLSSRISEHRHAAAAALELEVTELLHKLNMPAAEFSIRITPHQGELRANGMDDVEFMIKTNAGGTTAPLAQIASGGELSRISLALQVALAKHHPVPTLVFDEVDAGVGGKTAEMTGRMLQRLGRNVQVFCITHLAQVASFATCHHLVDKQSGKDHTLVYAEKLSDEERNREIARMLAGSKISHSALQNAREMLDAAAETARAD